MMSEDEARANGLTIKEKTDEGLGLTVTDQQLLEELLDAEGMDEEEMLENALFDGVSPGICKTPGCGYTTQVEPDSDSGWCEFCQDTTVVSGAVLAGII